MSLVDEALRLTKLAELAEHRDLDVESELSAPRRSAPQADPRLPGAQRVLVAALAAREDEFNTLGIDISLVKHGRISLSLRLYFANTVEEPLRARSMFPFVKTLYDTPRKAKYCLFVDSAGPVAGARFNPKHEAAAMVGQLLRKLRNTEFAQAYARAHRRPTSAPCPPPPSASWLVGDSRQLAASCFQFRAWPPSSLAIQMAGRLRRPGGIALAARFARLLMGPPDSGPRIPPLQTIPEQSSRSPHRSSSVPY